MRFDDMLATVLARPAERPADRVAQWRQLLDLLAQRRPGADPRLSREALQRLQSLRAEVPVTIRQETARAFAGRPVPAVLVAFLAADVPAVAGAILSHVRLDEGGWLSILPRLSPTGRGFLRHRHDLGHAVETALAGFGATDLAIGGDGPPIDPLPFQLPDPAPPAEILRPAEPHPAMRLLEDDPAERAELPMPEGGPGEGQIRAIITRIARFRKARDGSGFPGNGVTGGERATAFRFETGTDGIIRWVDGAPRGPLVGETIALPAAGAYGVDAQAPGAFRLRAPFRDARLLVAGGSAAAGEWRIAGVPVFAPEDGRFQGYRGTARRPRADETAAAPVAAPGLYGGGLEADSLRQLVHELRTPLNAIGGFAEMIRRQMRGPVSTTYRDRAQNIAEHAGLLLAAVDDLDVAARLETHKLDLQRVEVDLGAMLGLICANHVATARRRGATLDCGVASGLPPVMGDPAALRRMIGRLVASATALADEQETIRATLAGTGDANLLELSVARPARLDGQAESVLLDPAHGPEGDSPDGPLLGLGFSLHLVRRLAAAAGGTLTIEPARFLLRLPVGGHVSRADMGA